MIINSKLYVGRELSWHGSRIVWTFYGKD